MTETDTTQRDELREQIAEAFHAQDCRIDGCAGHREHWLNYPNRADAVLAVRDEELERLKRRRADDTIGVVRAWREKVDWQKRRAEAAEAELERLQAELQDERKGGPR